MFDNGESTSQLVLVLPALMKVVHEGLKGGHFAINETVNIIKGNFVWGDV